MVLGPPAAPQPGRKGTGSFSGLQPHLPAASRSSKLLGHVPDLMNRMVTVEPI
eukprot:SAG22_NODE_98_length_20720_cov_17.226662_17_plen_53_part_00